MGLVHRALVCSVDVGESCVTFFIVSGEFKWFGVTENVIRNKGLEYILSQYTQICKNSYLYSLVEIDAKMQEITSDYS